MWIHAVDDGIIMDIKVQPKSSRPGIGPLEPDFCKVRVNAPPTDGKANAAVIKLFSKTLKIPKSSIIIIKGALGRRKTIKINNVSVAGIMEVIK